MSKILITTESIAGSGHLKAAESLKDGLISMDGNIEVVIRNTLSFVSPLLEKMTRESYLHTLNKAPRLWGWAYGKEGIWSAMFKESLGHMLSFRLSMLIRLERPDVIVCTHAFCLSGFAKAKTKYGFSYSLGAAITDFDVNGFWVHEDVDFYLVAHEKIRDKLIHTYNVPEHNVYVTGIPISPRFQTAVDKKVLRDELGLNREIPTLLLLGGGTGWGPIEEVVEAIEEIQQPLQIVVITGSNEQLREKLKRKQAETHHHLKVEGYVKNMESWMGASDLVVTKPGGLTASEALASGLPLIIYKGIPGQEERNANFLLAHQVAFRAQSKEQLRQLIEDNLMDEKGKLLMLRQRIACVGKPDSSLTCASVIVDKLKNNQHVEVGCYETV